MKLFLSTICIFLSFFFGYNFSEQKNSTLRDSYQNEQYFVNITLKKNKLKINKNNAQIEVLINGETLQNEMTLENICE